MKLAITNEKEIKHLMDLCNEVESFYKLLNETYYKDIDLEDDKEFFKILYPIWKQADGDSEEFMTNVFKQFDVVHFRRILWNCSTLLTNCADLESDTLDFNKDIKKGFELLAVAEKESTEETSKETDV